MGIANKLRREEEVMDKIYFLHLCMVLEGFMKDKGSGFSLVLIIIIILLLLVLPLLLVVVF